MFNPYLCRECFKNKYHYTDEMIERAIRERRLPVWGFTQDGKLPVCGVCGKEGEVFG